eukprot:1252498-Alexandrium_andersonii.AAC.1
MNKDADRRVDRGSTRKRARQGMGDGGGVQAHRSHYEDRQGIAGRFEDPQLNDSRRHGLHLHVCTSALARLPSTLHPHISAFAPRHARASSPSRTV